MTLGESGGDLYLQVTPTRAQAKEIAGFSPPEPLNENDPTVTELKTRLTTLAAAGVHIDDAAVIGAIFRHDGMPVVIAHNVPADLLAARSAKPDVQAARAATARKTDTSWGAAFVRAVMHVVDSVTAAFHKMLTA